MIKGIVGLRLLVQVIHSEARHVLRSLFIHHNCALLLVDRLRVIRWNLDLDLFLRHIVARLNWGLHTLNLQISLSKGDPRLVLNLIDVLSNGQLLLRRRASLLGLRWPAGHSSHLHGIHRRVEGGVDSVLLTDLAV